MIKQRMIVWVREKGNKRKIIKAGLHIYKHIYNIFVFIYVFNDIYPQECDFKKR